MSAAPACFETPAARAPQHDEDFCTSPLSVILRSGGSRVSKDATCAMPLTGAAQ